MIGIYKITNPKGKVYIGQSVNIENRIKYYSSLRCKNQNKIFNSIKKYGFNNHSFEVLEECSVDFLNENERKWQDFFNSVKEGLNCRLTKTKDKSGSISEETKNKIRNFNLGKKLTEKQKLNISLKTKEGMNNIQLKVKLSENAKNRFFSEETRKKMSIQSTGRKHTDKTKKILSENRFGKNNPNAKIVLDLNTGVFYDTAVEFSNLYKINKSTFRHYLSGYIKQEKYNVIYV